MISGSKCRHLNSAGRGLIMEHTAAYQTRSLSFCNTADNMVDGIFQAMDEFSHCHQTDDATVVVLRAY